MTAYRVTKGFASRIDSVVILLRREGFAAWAESSLTLVTNAPRATILLVAGHGQFLRP